MLNIGTIIFAGFLVLEVILRVHRDKQLDVPLLRPMPREEELEVVVDTMICDHIDRDSGTIESKTFLSAVLTPVEIFDVLETVEDRFGVEVPESAWRSAATYGELLEAIVDYLDSHRRWSAT